MVSTSDLFNMSIPKMLGSSIVMNKGALRPIISKLPFLTSCVIKRSIYYKRASSQFRYYSTEKNESAGVNSTQKPLEGSAVGGQNTASGPVSHAILAQNEQQANKDLTNPSAQAEFYKLAFVKV